MRTASFCGTFCTGTFTAMNSGFTWDTCDRCHGSGYEVLQRAGDPVPGYPGYRFASTLYAPCGCHSERQIVAVEHDRHLGRGSLRTQAPAPVREGQRLALTRP